MPITTPQPFLVPLFVDIAAVSVPEGIDCLQTTGRTIQGLGSARYLVGPAGQAVPETSWSTNTANGRAVTLNETAPTAGMFGAIGNGDETYAGTNTTAIQQGADFVASRNGILVLEPGTFFVNFVAHPTTSGAMCVLALPSGVIVQGAHMTRTVIKLAANQTATGNSAEMVTNRNQSGGDIGIWLRDMTLDGNAANQSNVYHQGLYYIRTTSSGAERVRVTNVRGTGDVAPYETFHVETQLGIDTSFLHCEVVGSSGSTASGFSADSATNVRWVGCTAHGMTNGHGFTAYGCVDPLWIGCYAYSNGGYGFNVEESFAPTYNGCIAGGFAANGSFSPAPGTNLGNAGTGFCINGSAKAVLSGCQAYGNGHGLFVAAGASTYGPCSGRVTGCNLINNTQSGFTVLDVPTSARWRIENCDLGGNGVTAVGHPDGYVVSVPGAILPTPAMPAQGVRWINPYPFVVDIYIKGGGTGLVQLNDTDNVESNLEGLYRLAPGADIILYYGGSASWTLHVAG